MGSITKTIIEIIKVKLKIDHENKDFFLNKNFKISINYHERVKCHFHKSTKSKIGWGWQAILAAAAHKTNANTSSRYDVIKKNTSALIKSRSTRPSRNHKHCWPIKNQLPNAASNTPSFSKSIQSQIILYFNSTIPWAERRQDTTEGVRRQPFCVLICHWGIQWYDPLHLISSPYIQ